MQLGEFVRTREKREGMKAKSLKSRCGKLDARNSKGVCREAVLILIVQCLLQWTGYIFTP
jgi:hypothetical protein